MIYSLDILYTIKDHDLFDKNFLHKTATISCIQK